MYNSNVTLPIFNKYLLDYPFQASDLKDSIPASEALEMVLVCVRSAQQSALSKWIM